MLTIKEDAVSKVDFTIRIQIKFETLLHKMEKDQDRFEMQRLTILLILGMGYDIVHQIFSYHPDSC